MPNYPVTRESDDELLGYVEDVDGVCTPTTVFGAPIGGATDRDTAEAIVAERGMSILADGWEYRDDAGEWLNAWIVEASPESVSVVTGTFYADPTTRFTLPAPVDDRLRPRDRRW